MVPRTRGDGVRNRGRRECGPRGSHNKPDSFPPARERITPLRSTPFRCWPDRSWRARHVQATSCITGILAHDHGCARGRVRTRGSRPRSPVDGPESVVRSTCAAWRGRGRRGRVGGGTVGIDRLERRPRTPARREEGRPVSGRPSSSPGQRHAVIDTVSSVRCRQRSSAISRRRRRRRRHRRHRRHRSPWRHRTSPSACCRPRRHRRR